MTKRSSSNWRTIKGWHCKERLFICQSANTLYHCTPRPIWYNVTIASGTLLFFASIKSQFFLLSSPVASGGKHSKSTSCGKCDASAFCRDRGLSCFFPGRRPTLELPITQRAGGRVLPRPRSKCCFQGPEKTEARKHVRFIHQNKTDAHIRKDMHTHTHTHTHTGQTRARLRVYK